MCSVTFPLVPATLRCIASSSDFLFVLLPPSFQLDTRLAVGHLPQMSFKTLLLFLTPAVASLSSSTPLDFSHPLWFL
jgi:hypothetical protein